MSSNKQKEKFVTKKWKYVLNGKRKKNILLGKSI